MSYLFGLIRHRAFFFNTLIIITFYKRKKVLETVYNLPNLCIIFILNYYIYLNAQTRRRLSLLIIIILKLYYLIILTIVT